MRLDNQNQPEWGHPARKLILPSTFSAIVLAQAAAGSQAVEIAGFAAGLRPLGAENILSKYVRCTHLPAQMWDNTKSIPITPKFLYQLIR